MKVVSSKQMASLESLAYQEGNSEDDFMEEAGSGVALIVHDYAEIHNLSRIVILLCGQGNNAGDAYVAGINLLQLEYQVTAFQLVPISQCSRLCQQQYHRFLIEGGRTFEMESIRDLVLPSDGIIVDGIFGTGFHGSVSDPIDTVINLINQSNLPIISVDIPSGLNGNNGEVKGQAVIATETAFLGLPKIGFLLNKGWDHVGKLRYVDFGLPQKYIEDATTDISMLTTEEMKPLLPKLRRSRHKYEAGYVVGLTGSPGMSGAALLSADSALHSGAGIVRILFPTGMETEFGGSNPEILKMPYSPTDVESIAQLMNAGSANYIGPGLGRRPETLRLIQRLLPLIQKPCVIDADALFWLSDNDVELPANSILTPHRGEMNRLLKIDKDLPLDRDYLDLCAQYARNKKCTLILKGGPTFIFHDGESIKVCPRGDPGMATAGSGDLLTGLLAGLLAQGMSPHNAACMGVYIHGIAGEYAATELTSYCMTASDILYHYPEGFLFYEPA